MHPGEVNIRNVAPASFLAGIEHSYSWGLALSSEMIMMNYTV